MEAQPPSYAQSTVAVNPLTLIACHLDTTDLVNALRVCRRWHAALITSLWGDPGSHFARLGRHDSLYDRRANLLRFSRVLRQYCPEARNLVHTLRLPLLALDADYGAPQDWLKFLVQSLPHLQALDLEGLPIVDHASLCELRKAYENESRVAINIRLVSLARCINITSFSLASALEVFHQVVYLDLSGLSAAKDIGVFEAVRRLDCLKILKVSCCALDDSNADLLCKAIQRKVRCLDLSQNPAITDMTLFKLIETSLANAPTRNLGEDAMTETRTAFISRRVNHLALENEYDIGVTQLDVSLTSISKEAVYHLLFQGQLESLTASSLLYVSSVKDHTFDLAKWNHALAQPLSYLRYLCVSLGVLQLFDTSHENSFDLRSFPYLNKMSITDIPHLSADAKSARTIIAIIEAAAAQARMVSLTSRITSVQSMSKQSVELRKQRLEPGTLQSIHLEIASATPQAKTRSMTGDMDGELLWTAAESDFSFFGPSFNDSVSDSFNVPEHNELRDTVKEVAAFRRQAEAEYRHALQSGHQYPKTEGYWPGSVTVARL